MSSYKILYTQKNLYVHIENNFISNKIFVQNRMDPILRVILYLLEENNVEINIKVDTIESFFKSGFLFPKFVSIAFQVDEIPNIHPNPLNDDEKEENNKITLQFLNNNFSPISKANPNILTYSDQILKTFSTNAIILLNILDIILQI